MSILRAQFAQSFAEKDFKVSRKQRIKLDLDHPQSLGGKKGSNMVFPTVAHESLEGNKENIHGDLSGGLESTRIFLQHIVKLVDHSLICIGS
jgi:hypothetical protein